MKNMAEFFQKFITNLEKFFAPFPHFPTNFLKTLLPIIPWYLFLRGLIEIIGGLKSLSTSFQLDALPKVFAEFIEFKPAFLFWNGITMLIIGFLYFTAFTQLAHKKTQLLGWQNWLLATIPSTISRLYLVIFNHDSIFLTLVVTFIGWFFIFEFKKLYTPPKTKKNTSKPKD